VVARTCEWLCINMPCRYSTRKDTVTLTVKIIGLMGIFAHADWHQKSVDSNKLKVFFNWTELQHNVISSKSIDEITDVCFAAAKKRPSTNVIAIYITYCTLASTWPVSIGRRRGSSVICVASHARAISVRYWSASVSKPSTRWLNLICVFITISDQSISRCVYWCPSSFGATCGCASNTRSWFFADAEYVTAVTWRIWLRSSFSVVCLVRF